MTASRPRIRFICSLLVLCSGLSYTTAFAESSSSAPDSEQLNKQISKGEHASVIDQLTKRISKEGAETEPDVVRALLRALRITGKYGEGATLLQRRTPVLTRVPISHGRGRQDS